MKKLNNIIVAQLIVFFLVTSGMASHIVLSERQGPPGSILNIPVNISDAENVAGAQFVIQYDPALLEFVEINLSDFSANFVHAFDSMDDRIAVTIAGASGFEDSEGIFFSIRFRIKRSAEIGTATEITILSFELYDESGGVIQSDVTHGVIKVSEIVVYPNPITPNDDGFNDVANFVVPDSIRGNVTVKLYSLSGSKIAEISGIDNPALQWNGLNMDGQKLRPGPYIYLLQSDGSTLSKGTITIMH